MNSKKHSSYVFLSLILFCSSFTLFASPFFKPIKASMNTNFKYSLNGAPILAKTPAIIYEGTVYAPINKLVNALGYEIAVQNNQAIISTPVPTPAKDTVTISNATITAIDFATDRITVYPTNKANTMLNQVDLFITKNTVITDGKTKRVYSIQDLNTGMPVKVVYSSRVTKSIPPQSEALQITLLNSSNTPQPR